MLKEINKKLLERFKKNPERWIKQAIGYDITGKPVTFGSQRLWCGCLINHTINVCNEIKNNFPQSTLQLAGCYVIALSFLKNVDELADWNDGLTTTVHDIIKLLEDFDKSSYTQQYSI